MTPSAVPFDVIVPARNEAAALHRTAPALAAALRGTGGRAIYVLNATTDGSADLLRAVPGLDPKIVELAAAGKARALAAGDRAARHDLRFYLDADVRVAPGTFEALTLPLASGRADLVAPRIRVNVEGARSVPRQVGRIWGDQLARRPDAFMTLTGYGPAGLRARGPWPDVIADDDWGRDRIAPSRRLILEEVTVEIDAPRTLADWIAVRARWLRGSRELRRRFPGAPPPVRIPLRGDPLDLAAYLAVRLAAVPVSLLQEAVGADWSTDRSTRRDP